MPQYKRIQYGLKQYGLFQPAGNNPEIVGRWQFVRSRFGYRRDGATFWLYLHTAVALPGKITRFRLSASTGDTIYEESRDLPGAYRRVRLSSNLNPKPIESGIFTMKGADA